jgi:hypothetical protein
VAVEEFQEDVVAEFGLVGFGEMGCGGERGNSRQ